MATLTPEQLDLAAAKDAVSTYLRVKARDFHRRQMNRIWPAIQAQVEQAIANGDALDLPALTRAVYESGPESLLGSAE
jgi:hypothetical protein